jgi:hypothetical protein
LTNLTPSQLLSEEAWKDWLQHPVTQGLRAWLTRRREQEKERLATGDFICGTIEGTTILHSAVIAQCKLCAELLALEYEDLVEEEGEQGGKFERAEALGQSGVG